MTYSERLRRYEEEKKELFRICSDSKEYEQRLQEISRKWKV